MEINVNLFSLLLGVGLSVLLLILYLFILWVERRTPKRKNVFERAELITIGIPKKPMPDPQLDLLLTKIHNDLNEAYEKERMERTNAQNQAE